MLTKNVAADCNVFGRRHVRRFAVKRPNAHRTQIEEKNSLYARPIDGFVNGVGWSDAALIWMVVIFRAPRPW